MTSDARIEELREQDLKVVRRVALPVDADRAWALLGDPRRFPDLMKDVASVEVVPGGYKVKIGPVAVSARLTHCVPPRALILEWTSGGEALGLRLPKPELDCYWVAIDIVERGVEVEVGRAFRFKGRLAQHAGKALLPIHGRTLDEVVRNVETDLAPTAGVDLVVPALGPDGANLVGGVNPPTLRPEDVRRLKEAKLQGHLVAAMLAGVAKQSRNPDTRRMGELGLKATVWHAERKAQRDEESLVASDDWAELISRLSNSLEPRLHHPHGEDAVRAMVVVARQLGLSVRSDITAAIGVVAYGHAVGSLESASFPTRVNRPVKKFAEMLRARSYEDPEIRLATGATAAAKKEKIGGKEFDLDGLDGFSTLIHSGLIDAAGTAVDTSPDLPEGRPKAVRRATADLYAAGRAMATLRPLLT